MSVIIKTHKELIALVAPYVPQNPVLVEAGAFNGSDTCILATSLPGAIVHAFEPVPAIYERLTQRVSDLPQVHTYQCALSDINGEALFYVSEKPNKPGIASQAGSLHKPKERLSLSPIQFPYTIQVPTITLDEWAKNNNIMRVDFLWLDLQGHELAVMKGAPVIMKTVSVIYTEVAFCNAYEDQPHYEKVKQWLELEGFTEVARDFEDQQKWFFGNVLFVRSALMNV